MEYILTQFASTAPEKADLFSSLGIDWRLLILQSVAFLILLVILRKWVYPPLAAMLDKRESDIRESAEAAQQAKKEAEAAEEKTAELLKKARDEAGEIVGNARDEATSVVELAHKKALDKADAIVAAAKGDIEKEIESAKKILHNETLNLVADATGAVLKKKVDTKTDTELIEQAVKEAKS